MVPTVIIDLVDQLNIKYSVKLTLEVLNISKSSYYCWKNNKFDKITQKNIELVMKLTTLPTFIIR